VLTHLHTDHAGGLEHFPRSEILVSRAEHRAASGTAGKVRGYLPHRWPTWFAPRLLDIPAERFGPFPESLALTSDGTVRIVATPGHTAGHLSVIAEDEGASIMFAGDASYTQDLMVRGAIDGVAPDPAAARTTLDRIRRFTEERPVVYLPSHDPDAGERLERRSTS
jgi:glyoxylase-like metal-dependent hydrolase (beta-lactamase superfamily II)